jgi:hypothetical protein
MKRTRPGEQPCRYSEKLWENAGHDTQTKLGQSDGPVKPLESILVTNIVCLR